MPTDQPKNNDKRPSGKPASSVLKLTDMAFRMGIIIAIGAVAGKWLDEKMGHSTPIFALILSLLAIGGAIYMVIKDVSKPN